MEKAMEERIIRAMNTTWQAIGGDVLQAMQEVEGEDSVDREVVIEAVIDADSLRTFSQDKEAADALYTLSYEGMYAMGKKAFPFKTYGF